MDHLLLHGKVACALWNVFFSRFELSWVMSGRVIDLHACWFCAFRGIYRENEWLEF